MSAATVIPIPRCKDSLAEIVERLAALLDTVDLVETPEDRQACEAEIAETLAAEVRKVDGIASFLSYCESMQRFASEEISRLHERKARFARHEDRLRQYVIRTMEDADVKRLEGKTATFHLRACASSADIRDESAIPEKFKVSKVVITVDKRAVRAALESGEDVPGAELIIGKNTVVVRR